MYQNKYLKYKNKYLSLKMNTNQIGGAGGGGRGGARPVLLARRAPLGPVPVVAPAPASLFSLNERVIVDRKRIAKIISICQNSPDIGGNISYNIHYVDKEPRQLETNIFVNRLIRLPKNIHSDKYNILQPGQLVMVNNGSEEPAVILKIRGNTETECYSVRYTSRAMMMKDGKMLGHHSDECVDISKIRKRS